MRLPVGFRSAEKMRFVLTVNGVDAYIRPFGTSPAFKGRDGVPLKLLTGTVNRHPIVLGCAESRRLSGRPERGSPDPGLFEK